MAARYLTSAALIGVMTVAPLGEAAAQDGLIGGIVGGIVGGAIVNESNRQRSRQRVQRQRVIVHSATRQANRETQSALNYFDFHAGAPDGVIGPNTRRAVAQYQRFMGYPDTGQLTQFERDFLLTSYRRALAGGATTQQAIASNPQGARGLLAAYRDQMVAGAAAMAPAGTPLAAAEPETETGNGAMPSFFGADDAQPSLASHCNRVSLVTNANGGFSTLDTMTDPEFALNEQFCLARTYAIAQGEELASRVQGVSSQQVNEQCVGMVPALRSHVSALSLQPREEVVRGISSFVLESGMNPAQLSGTAKICLSVGYRTDNMDLAIGSALLLGALGERPYGELLGHHLVQGFGTSERRDLALEWYDLALTALEGGQREAFVPGQPERVELLRQAAYGLAGPSEAPQPSEPSNERALPVFTLAPD